MKAPSPAQLAARKRFAEMARSGAFKKKATKRKANPTDIHLAGNYYGKVSKDGTGSFWTYVVNRVKEVNPDGSLYETDDVVGDFKAKHYATMKGAINALDKYKTKLSGVKSNPAKKTVSQKISQLRHEGYPQRQAVAVALSEQRAGKVKRNPRPAKPKKYYQVSIMEEGTHTKFMPMALYFTFAEAENYANYLAKQHKNWTIRVHDTRAM